MKKPLFMISKCAKIVEQLLTSSPKLRDNDQQLVANVWYVQARDQFDIGKMTAKNFLHELAQGNLMSSESITRCRRKLQEEHIHLRGNKWAERHRMQKDVKEELRNWKDYANS
tara:strand:+ start:56 stop:394 length:339 start_codon:yes stop_codon:yes gene_type:complete